MLDAPAAPEIDRSALPHALDGGFGPDALIGLIALASDRTIEAEMRDVVARVPGVDLVTTRIRNDNIVTPTTLRDMEARLPACAADLLPGVPLRAIGYACTSASTLIGEARVEALIRGVRPEAAVSNPITAGKAALKALSVRRIALLTPYSADINAEVRAHLMSQGLDVPVMGTFDEYDDRDAARIDAESIKAAVLDLGGHPSVEGVFVSCTALRTVTAAGGLEAALGKPVTGSNHALGWHLLRRAGIDAPIDGLGRLYRLPAA